MSDNSNYGWPKEEELGGNGLFYKFIEGENIFRIVDDRPRRVEKTWDDGKVTTKYAFRAVRVADGPSGKQFHHCIVELGATVMKKLMNIRKEEDYGGDVREYTLKVIKSGDGMNTRYDLIALPPKPMPNAAGQALEEAKAIDLEKAINKGGAERAEDPFGDD